MDGVIVDSHPIHGVETTQEGRPPQQFYEKRGISASHPDEALVFEDSVSRIGCAGTSCLAIAAGVRANCLSKKETPGSSKFSSRFAEHDAELFD